MKIKNQEAQEIIYEDHADWEVVESSIEGQGRWDTHMFSICKHKVTGLYYGVNWSKGSTECQDQEPFYDDEVEFTEMEQVEVIKKEWKPKIKKQEKHEYSNGVSKLFQEEHE
jgi:hypothetical protein